MNCSKRVRLLPNSKIKIESSIEAFISSKLSLDWQSCEEIYKSVSGAVTKDQFDAIMTGFIDSGGIEIDTAVIKELVFNNSLDLRDYTGIIFNSDEIKEAPALPVNLKKEWHCQEKVNTFLSYHI